MQHISCLSKCYCNFPCPPVPIYPLAVPSSFQKRIQGLQKIHRFPLTSCPVGQCALPWIPGGGIAGPSFRMRESCKMCFASADGLRGPLDNISTLSLFFLLYFLAKEPIVECCKYFSFSELVTGGPRLVGFIGTGKAT